MPGSDRLSWSAGARRRVQAAARVVRRVAGGVVTVLIVAMAFLWSIVVDVWEWAWVRAHNRAVAAARSGRLRLAVWTAAAAGACLMFAVWTSDRWAAAVSLDVGGALVLFLALQLVVPPTRRLHLPFVWSLAAAGVVLLAVTWQTSRTDAVASLRHEVGIQIGVGVLLFATLDVWLAGVLLQVQDRERRALAEFALTHPEEPLITLLNTGGMVFVSEQQLRDMEALNAPLDDEFHPLGGLPYFTLEEQERWHLEIANHARSQAQRAGELKGVTGPGEQAPADDVP
jgi:hypothetical protein